MKAKVNVTVSVVVTLDSELPETASVGQVRAAAAAKAKEAVEDAARYIQNRTATSYNDAKKIYVNVGTVTTGDVAIS